MKHSFSYFILIFFLHMSAHIAAQDISLLHLAGRMQPTYLNPGHRLGKNVNLAMANLNLHANIDGNSINQLTRINADGNRYIYVDKNEIAESERNNILANADVHTIDIGIKTNHLAWMMGHTFRSFGQVSYTKNLLEILAYGNAPYIGQELDISTSMDISSFHELYLGAQWSNKNISIGIKGKYLNGINNLATKKSNINFLTNSDFYQLQLDMDVDIRSNGLLEYKSLKDSELNFSPFSLKNFLSGNSGFAFDLGAIYQIDDSWSISASILDIGNIDWDRSPKKYISKGIFTFDGLNLIDLIGDTTDIALTDTLIGNINVQTTEEGYNTSLPTRYILSTSYKLGKKWSFFGMYDQRNYENQTYRNLAISAVRKWKILEAGLSYSISKNNYYSFGLYSRINAGVFSAYVNINNILGISSPLDQKNLGLMLGTTLQF